MAVSTSSRPEFIITRIRVHLSSDGGKTSSTGSWVDGSSDTKFTQQTGALAGFRFDFSQPRNGQRLRGDLSFSMSESQAEGALGKAGFNSSLADNIGNPLHAVQLLHFHFRSLLKNVFRGHSERSEESARLFLLLKTKQIPRLDRNR